jgi:hypothetical protein
MLNVRGHESSKVLKCVFIVLSDRNIKNKHETIVGGSIIVSTGIQR